MNRAPPQVRSRWWWLGLLLVVVAAALALLLARQPSAAQAVAVQESALVRTLQFSARVAALSRVEVGSTVTGRVAQVLAREGDTVRAGQPLVQLEDEEFRAALAQATAAERQARARLAGLRSTGRSAAQAQLAQAEVGLSAARSELARAQQLVGQGFISASRLDEALRAVELAQFQRQAAAAQVQAMQDAGTDVAQAQALLQSASAATAAARARLAQTVVSAPADATVLLRAVEPGQIVQPGRALLGLALAGPTQIVAQVDERFLEQLQPRQKAAVVPDAFPQQRLAATVLSLSPQIDAQRGAVEVKFALDQPPPAFLRQDMTLSVEVETGRRERAMVIPARALRSTGSERDSVLVADQGRAAERPLRIGLRTLEAAEVLDGLRPGDLVLLEAALRPGDRVRPQRIEWQPARSPAAAPGGSGDPMSAISQGMGR